MALDPREIERANPQTAQPARVADLERRLQALERALGVIVPVTAGTPTDAPRDGALDADSSALRLWVRIGGAWHYTALT